MSSRPGTFTTVAALSFDGEVVDAGADEVVADGASTDDEVDGSAGR